MIYKFFHVLFSLYFKLFFRWRFYGLENLPSEGPFIICANHTSWFDPPLVGCMVPINRRVCFMAKEELFDVFFLGPVIKRMGAFPVRRDTADRRSIRTALKLLQEGNILGLFPEGTRSRSGELGEPFHGPAMIALKSGIPVLPVAIKWPSKIFRPVKVRVGSLIYFNEEGKIKAEVLVKVSARIMEEIKKLLVEL